MALFDVPLAADGVGGFNATPTGTHTEGMLYSAIGSFSESAAGAIVYISDSTATGSNNGDMGHFTGFAAGTVQVVYDPPYHFKDGLMVDVSATGGAGQINLHWTPVGGRGYTG